MTTVYKDFRKNWTAEDRIDLDSIRVLTILTIKTSSGELVTSCTMSRRDGEFLSHIQYQDYRRTLFKEVFKRLTRDVVVAQHSRAMTQLSAIKDDIARFYAAKELTV